MARLTVGQFNTYLENSILVYDGAMGTNLIAQQLKSENYGGKDGCSEALNLYCPESVSKVHKSFIEAGCDVIETNTFGGNSITLKEYGLEDKVAEINQKAVNIAKKAIEEAGQNKPRYIAGSIGPTSQLPSLGNIEFDDMVSAYSEQFEALWEAGIDILQIETCQDILQIKAALYAANKLFEKVGTRCPVVVSSTLESSGNLLIGSDIPSIVAAIEPFDFVDVLGFNCSFGPDEMERHVATLSKLWSKAILIMPNAGLPEMVDGKPFYKMTPEEFASFHNKFVTQYGINICGGCCGTRADHLAAVVKRVKDLKPVKRVVKTEARVSSLFNAVEVHQKPAPAMIGERTNANGAKKFREYLLADDFDGMVAMGKDQVKGGAHMVDLCVAYVGRNEAADMKKAASMFATQVNLPLVIDSTIPDVIETALKHHGGRCVINSVNLEDGGARLRKVAKLAKDFGAMLICLSIDEDGMAKTATRKLSIALRIKDILVKEFGFKESDLIFDPLTFTVGSGDAELRNSALETLNALKLISEKMPTASTILGLSNVSFGLKPAVREILNSVFMAEAVKHGLSTAIVNPAKILPLISIPDNQQELALNLIYNKHGDGSDLTAFLKAFEGETVIQKEKSDVNLTPAQKLEAKVLDGDSSELDALVEDLRKEFKPEAVINEILLPAMQKVGESFGTGRLQLPFVLQSAEVVKKTVDCLTPFMEKKEASADRMMILATVAGDVHDIGKNLVNIMLSNNGFSVVDLGIKVDISTMIKAAKENNSNVIGMSGLIVKSTVVMKENLEELNRIGFYPDVILGGAALTRDYVEKELQSIYKGRVFYAKDAVDTVNIMQRIMDERSQA